jgi:hypothetical protein
MVNFIQKISINAKLGYEIHLVEDEERLWLVLINCHSRKLIACWSSQETNKQILSYELVILSLIDRFKLLEKEQISLDDAVEFWPPNWDYWGRFTPEQFRGYIKNFF